MPRDGINSTLVLHFARQGRAKPPQEFADVVFQCLSAAERTAFPERFQENCGTGDGLGKPPEEEIAEHPDQTALSAAARAARSAGLSSRRLRTKKHIRASRRFWNKAQLQPAHGQDSAVGRPQKMDNAELICAPLSAQALEGDFQALPHKRQGAHAEKARRS